MFVVHTRYVPSTEKFPDDFPQQRHISAEKSPEDYDRYGETAYLPQVPPAPQQQGYQQPWHEPGMISHVADTGSYPSHQQRPAPMRRTPARHWWRWILWMVIFGLALWAVFDFFVVTNAGQQLEYRTLLAAQYRLDSMPPYIRDFLQQLPLIVGILGVGTFLVMTLIRRRWFASVVAVIVFLLSNGTTQLLKNVILERPYLDNGVPYLVGNSLPSGHTTFAAAAVISVMLVVAPRWRSLVAFWGAGFAIAVGVSTYLEAWHRPADMIAAFLVAGIWGLIGGLVIYRLDPEWNAYGPSYRRTPRSAWTGLQWGLSMLCLITAIGILLAATFFLDPAAMTTEGSHMGLYSWVYILFGSLVTAGSGGLVFAVVATLFRTEAGLR